ncbi:DUF3649 domain-containing protein [Cupriavidus basilensis]|uniref:DUF3649 domain-containing protein n=1 Tax=Cupriavidus basilensis TaxID=68895 RepID=A0ABT6AX75_9BURK|nr:DUF3649 domain-containing protein [Cupriavidus basilensis]MDF3837183.1 DUF3649 domain-containing protein [Cupriavidus basilensis]
MGLSQTGRYRLGVASRVVAAIGGGYVLAAVATGLLAVLLPLPPAEAVMTATLLSFSLYACSVLWVFAAGSAWQAWAGVALPAAVLGAVLALLRSAS